MGLVAWNAQASNLETNSVFDSLQLFAPIAVLEWNLTTSTACCNLYINDRVHYTKIKFHQAVGASSSLLFYDFVFNNINPETYTVHMYKIAQMLWRGL